jgi:hypothetical protein
MKNLRGRNPTTLRAAMPGKNLKRPTRSFM